MFDCFSTSFVSGCGILFLNETKTSPLAVVDTSNTQRIVGVSYDTLNRSINCSLDTQRSAYLGCTGTWITPVSSEHAWSSFSLGFIPHTSKLNLTVRIHWFVTPGNLHLD